MQLRTVESSCISAIGFENGVIRVLWKGGRYTDFNDRTQQDYDDLLAAPSKGRFVRERLAGGSRAPEGQPTTPVPLDTYEHDDCCSKRLSKALSAGSLASVDVWTCPSCYVEWRAAAVEGLGRHWKPYTWAGFL